MRPRQRLRSTASQATINTSPILDTPAFTRSSSPQSLAERLTSQLPRSDEIALSDTSGRHSRSSSIGSSNTFQTADYAYSAPPQTPVRRRRASDIPSPSPAKRNTWFAGKTPLKEEEILTEEESSNQLDVPRLEPSTSRLQVADARSPPSDGHSLRVQPPSKEAKSRRSWFGVAYKTQPDTPNGQDQVATEPAVPSIPESSASAEAAAATSPSNNIKATEPESSNPSVAIDKSQPQSPQPQAGWLSWIGMSRPNAAPKDIQSGKGAVESTTSEAEPSPGQSAQPAPFAAIPPASEPPVNVKGTLPSPEPATVANAQSPPSSSYSLWTRWTGTAPTPAPAPSAAAKTDDAPIAESTHAETSNSTEEAGPPLEQTKADKRPQQTESRSGWFGSWRTQPSTPHNPTNSDPVQSESSYKPSEAPLSPAPSTPKSQPANTIISAVPSSTWASWFSLRHDPSQKRITDAQPENMEVEFPPELASSNPPTATQQQQQPQAKAPSAIKARSTPVPSSQSVKRSGSQSSFFAAGNNSRPTSIRSQGRSEGPEPPHSNLAKPLTQPTSSPNPNDTTSAADSGKGKGKAKAAETPAMPNLLLPSFEDTFDVLPRSLPLSSKSVAANVARRFGSALWGEDPVHKSLRKGANKNHELDRLPRKLSVLGLPQHARIAHARKFAILTTHGWFAGPLMRTLFGEPTGTSIKFATMQKEALKSYFSEKGRSLSDEDITVIPLEGEGKVEERVNKLADALYKRQDWLEALQQADCIFVATHSQGSVVSTHLLERLIKEGKIDGRKCSLLCLAAISQGPFASLNTSYSTSVYFNFDAPARELFEFQLGTSVRSIKYREALTSILSANVRVLLCASLSDQVVPLYSGMFTSFSHPNLLRSVFIDGQSFRAVDFMSNLVCFAVRIRNAGLSDHGLMEELSEALAGALSGSGHSVLYDDPQPYLQSIRYFFESDIPPELLASPAEPNYEPHNARKAGNPYTLPWALRGLLEDPQISKLFAAEISELREQFENWTPTSKRLQDIRYRLAGFNQIPRPSKPKL